MRSLEILNLPVLPIAGITQHFRFAWHARPRSRRGKTDHEVAQFTRWWGSKVGEEESNRYSSCVITKIESVNLHSFLLQYLVFGVWPCPLKIYSKKVKADLDIRDLSSNQSNKTSLTDTLYQVDLGYRAAKMTNPPTRPLSPSCESKCPTLRCKFANALTIAIHVASGKC